MSKSNWFKRSGSNQEEEPARKRGRPQTPNPEEEVLITEVREVPLISILKVASLNQEVIRRILNTSEDLDDAMRMTVVDNFAKKVRNSGYCIKQTRDIMMGGLKGYAKKN